MNSNNNTPEKQIQEAVNYKPVFATIDTADGEITYKAMHNGSRWNGFLIPWFDLETAKKVLADMEATGATRQEAIDTETSFYEYDEANDLILESWVYDGEQDQDQHEPLLIDGIKYYTIGYCNWCWTESKAMPSEDTEEANYEDLAHMAFYSQYL